MAKYDPRPGQLQLFNPDRLSKGQFSRVRAVDQAIARYAEEQGMPAPRQPSQAMVPGHVGFDRYIAYRDALSAPADPAHMADSYRAATEHIRKQYEFMTRPVEQGGMGITHEIVTEDPYKHPREIADDIRKNRRIKTFATTSTSAGSGEQAPTNQAFDNETNDMFRAVHDVFGHVATGRDFTAHGEDAAYRMHTQLFPEAAHAAITSELRGQNSYLVYGPNQDFPDPGTRMVGLPKWVEGTEGAPRPKRQRRKKNEGQMTLDI